MDHIEKSQITGLILAGGKASRMGGSDKGLVEFRGKPLVEYVFDTLKGQCAEVMISANRNEEIYRGYGCRVVRDAQTGFPGPLAGIAAGLSEIESDYLVVAPCDSPYLPNDYVERLAQGLESHPHSLVAAARAAGREQPVFMLIKREALPAVNNALASGQSAVYRWLNETMHAIWVDFEDSHAFENMNRPEDLQQ